MIINEDWVEKAAREIYGGHDASEGEIAATIRQHCPLEPGIAYIPVPQCETLKIQDLIGMLRLEAEQSLADANHYALNTTIGADRVCQYWRGRASAFRQIEAILRDHSNEVLSR
jgi:hypothetical protein